MTPRRLLLLFPLSLALLLSGPLAASAQPTTFPDTAGTAHEAAVAALVDEGIVRGCTDDAFCARDQLTRGQVATMLAGTLALEEVETGRFDDTADSRHVTAIDTLAEAGLIAGCDDQRFCPREPVTREQLATMLHQAFDIPAAPAETRYFDDVEGIHAPGVRALAEAGIAAGCDQRLTSFCADGTVQRAHAALFLARTLELVERVELAPFEDRDAEQQAIDEAAAQAAAEAAEAAAAKAAAVAAPGEEAVEVAMDQLGKPYRWAGSGPHSFDCSGLTSYAWAKAGVDLPRSSRAQYRGTERISRSELRPGDLVFYHSPVSHVAMYIGDGKVVESPNSGNNVRIREDGLTRRGVVGFGRP